ncbi:hypothetical protein [Bradyrhizobium ottawaense]|uniref:hypothetical protein n=1 Tax=Bradyrhizobium ottawaense TaxID=931866 RepID=UPI003F9EF65E
MTDVLIGRSQRCTWRAVEPSIEKKWIESKTRIGMWLPGGCLCGPFQELSRLNVERVGRRPHDFDADVVRTLFKLAQIAPADLGLESKFNLGPSPRVAQTAQTSGECLPQIHAGQEALCFEILHLDIFDETSSSHREPKLLNLLQVRKIIRRKSPPKPALKGYDSQRKWIREQDLYWDGLA